MQSPVVVDLPDEIADSITCLGHIVMLEHVNPFIFEGALFKNSFSIANRPTIRSRSAILASSLYRLPLPANEFCAQGQVLAKNYALARLERNSRKYGLP